MNFFSLPLTNLLLICCSVLIMFCVCAPLHVSWTYFSCYCGILNFNALRPHPKSSRTTAPNTQKTTYKDPREENEEKKLFGKWKMGKFHAWNSINKLNFIKLERVEGENWISIHFKFSLVDDFFSIFQLGRLSLPLLCLDSFPTRIQNLILIEFSAAQKKPRVEDHTSINLLCVHREIRVIKRVDFFKQITVNVWALRLDYAVQAWPA